MPCCTTRIPATGESLAWRLSARLYRTHLGDTTSVHITLHNLQRVADTLALPARFAPSGEAFVDVDEIDPLLASGQPHGAANATAVELVQLALGQRSLVDLLNGQNQLFNGLVSLISAQSVSVFADYQLLAAMGGLIQYVKAPPPADAAPLEVEPFGLIPTKLPPIHLRAPTTGPEPLQVPHAGPVPALNYAAAADGTSPPSKPELCRTVEWPESRCRIDRYGVEVAGIRKNSDRPLNECRAKKRRPRFEICSAAISPRVKLALFISFILGFSHPWIVPAI